MQHPIWRKLVRVAQYRLSSEASPKRWMIIVSGLVRHSILVYPSIFHIMEYYTIIQRKIDSVLCAIGLYCYSAYKFDCHAFCLHDSTLAWVLFISSNAWNTEPCNTRRRLPQGGHSGTQYRWQRLSPIARLAKRRWNQAIGHYWAATGRTGRQAPSTSTWWLLLYWVYKSKSHTKNKSYEANLVIAFPTILGLAALLVSHWS